MPIGSQKLTSTRKKKTVTNLHILMKVTLQWLGSHLRKFLHTNPCQCGRMYDFMYVSGFAITLSANRMIFPTFYFGNSQSTYFAVVFNIKL